MKNGKITDTVLKRSVLSVLSHRHPGVIKPPNTGEDCSVIEDGDDYIVMSTDPITGATEDVGRLSVHVTVNDLASSGAEPVGVLLSILLPEGTKESALKSMMEDAEAAAEECGIDILGGHTEITPAVNRVIITATGIGRADKLRLTPTSGARSGDSLVLTKWVGLEGTSIIAKEKREQLMNRLPEALVTEASRFDRYMSVLPEARVAASLGAHAMHDVTEGGIFGALWEIAEASGLGVTADIRKIPIRQETVEICEFFDISPYLLISSGSMLIAIPDGETLVLALEKEGIHSAVIGRMTPEKNRRIVHMDETDRVLTEPEPDELYKVI